MYKTLFALGYYGLMRIGELTKSPHSLKAGNVYLSTNKEKLLLVLYTSKTTGLDSRPQHIKITSNKSEKTGSYVHRNFCPFKLVSEYLIFRRKIHTKENDEFFLFSDGSPVLAHHVRALLKQLIASLDLQDELYNTHSLCIG